MQGGMKAAGRGMARCSGAACGGKVAGGGRWQRSYGAARSARHGARLQRAGRPMLSYWHLRWPPELGVS
jgi:hypothetical protein